METLPAYHQGHPSTGTRVRTDSPIIHRPLSDYAISPRTAGFPPPSHSDRHTLQVDDSITSDLADIFKNTAAVGGIHRVKPLGRTHSVQKRAALSLARLNPFQKKAQPMQSSAGYVTKIPSKEAPILQLSIASVSSQKPQSEDEFSKSFNDSLSHFDDFRGWNGFPGPPRSTHGPYNPTSRRPVETSAEPLRSKSSDISRAEDLDCAILDAFPSHRTSIYSQDFVLSTRRAPAITTDAKRSLNRVYITEDGDPDAVHEPPRPRRLKTPPRPSRSHDDPNALAISPGRERTKDKRMETQVVSVAPSGTIVAAKLPSPGPAPTKALPSIPSVSNVDDGSSLRTRKGVHQTQSCDSNKENRPQSRATDASSITVSESISSSATKESSIDDTRSQSTHDAKPADTIKVTRKSREERVKARKMRDLQSIRARHENKKLDEALDQRLVEAAINKEIQQSARISGLSHASGSTSSSGTDNAAKRVSPRMNRPGSLTLPKRVSARFQANSMSPIMLVLEQRPVSDTNEPHRHTLVVGKQHSSLSLSTPNTPITPTLWIPSSAEGTPQRSPSHNGPNCDLAQNMTRPESCAKEGEIEARISAMEKRNELLEATLMAMLRRENGSARVDAMDAGRLPGVSPQCQVK
ncbi:MAG: hypothetical protein M1833_006292 [Piccolia ochrophora]|nr:MAG: hypothetical protein M1833_006292 [Piccolia ochrophora]